MGVFGLIIYTWLPTLPGRSSATTEIDGLQEKIPGWSQANRGHEGLEFAMIPAFRSEQQPVNDREEGLSEAYRSSDDYIVDLNS